VERVAIVARLKPGARERALELLAAGPPFDVAESGLASHAVFVSAREVVFVFAGEDVSTVVGDLVDDPFRRTVIDALADWRAIVEGPPRIAREAFSWEREDTDG
jgi:hypothetical protein